MEINEPDFLIEAELLGPVPRRVVATLEARMGWRVGWNLLLAIVCVIYYAGAREMAQLRDLAEHGQNLDGYVVSAKPLYEISVSSPEDDNAGCEVVFAARPDGSGTQHPFDFTEWRFGMPVRGESFHVVYVPGNPLECRLASVRSADFANCRVRWILPGLGCVAPGALIMWGIYLRGEDRRRLLQFGTAATGTVWSRRYEKGEDAPNFYLSYTVPLPDGTTREEQIAIQSSVYEALPIGSKFPVLIDDASSLIAPYFTFTGFEVQGVPKRKFA